MKCNCCGKEIEQGKIYEIEEELYCDTCVIEKTVTYYTVQNNSHKTYRDGEVGIYYDQIDLLTALEERMKWAELEKEELKNISKKLNYYEEQRLLQALTEIAKIRRILVKMRGE